MDKKRFWLTGFIILLLLSIPAFYIYSKSAPRRTASAYLKAASTNDLDKLKLLSYPTHWGEIAAKGVRIRPLSWQLVSEQKTDIRKKEFDLSQAAYKKEVASALHLYNEPKVALLRDETLKKRLESYGSWRAENVATYGLFEENGRFYYTDSTPRDELVYAITEEAGKPPVEYMLALEQKSSGGGKWEVTEFGRR
jgi:hypothetical protein